MSDQKDDNVKPLPGRQLPPVLQEILRKWGEERDHDLRRVTIRTDEYQRLEPRLTQDQAMIAALLDEVLVLRTDLRDFDKRLRAVEDVGKVPGER
jgi:hypothetical protein